MGEGNIPVLNSKTSEHTFQKWKQNKDLFQTNKSWENLLPEDYRQTLKSLLGWLKIISGKSFEIHENEGLKAG